MKNRIIQSYGLICLIALVLLASCKSDYLDRRPETSGYDFEKVYGDSTNYWLYCTYLVVNPLFLHLQIGDSPRGSWDDISDNSMFTHNSNDVPSLHAISGNYYNLTTLGHAKMCNNQTWENHWRHLRIANTGIQNIEYYTGSEFTKRKILGLCYFYRGYVYMELCKRWGGMPYLTAPLQSDESMDLPRLSMQETYVLAAQDFETAASYLRNRIPENEFQYPTRIAALAMKSRCLLYAASDQARTEDHPGNPKKDLWEEAALAADYALKEAEKHGYKMVQWKEGDTYGNESYYYVFKGFQMEHWCNEVLFGRRSRINWGSDAYNSNMKPPGQLGGLHGVSVSQLLVESFEMKETGLPIGEPDSKYNEQDPYKGRDPRFYHNIMFNGCEIMNYKLEIWNFNDETGLGDAKDLLVAGGVVQNGSTLTGTYARKWMGKEYNAQLHQCWSYIRLAEVYLNFAEAANEAWGAPDAKRGDCLYSAAGALNKVRNRSLMPDINARFLTDKDKFRTRVRNERRVEHCFEEQRLFDVRRWLTGTKSPEKDIWKVTITKLAPGTYDTNAFPTGFRYERLEHRKRVYEDRHNLFVIRRDDTRLGPNFKQNPGW